MNKVEIKSCYLVGIEAREVNITVESVPGLQMRPDLQMFTFIGLPDTTAHETKYRVLSAYRSLECGDLPHSRIIVTISNIGADASKPAPAKTGFAVFDLPIALALCELTGLIPRGTCASTLVVGELNLQGRVRPIRGVFQAAELALAKGYKRFVCPPDNKNEARLVIQHLEGVLAPTDLVHLRAHILREADCFASTSSWVESVISASNMNEIVFNADVERAMMQACIYKKSLLFVGPPGSGKTMLAKRIPSILPLMSSEERAETQRIWSAAGLLHPQSRPFRAPHHTISEAGLMGGGSPVRPGEISLAHNGVLFLDDVSELPKRIFFSLSPVLKTGVFNIERSKETIRIPARPAVLVGAMTSCPCGRAGDPSDRCRCTPDEITRHLARVPKDFFDITVNVPTTSATELLEGKKMKSSEEYKKLISEVGIKNP